MALQATALVIGGIGLQEILVILLILLLLFGGRKIPELARGLGKGISEFKRGVHDPSDEEKKSLPRNADSSSRKEDGA